jgi:sec-independent protein translocase protein TatA
MAEQLQCIAFISMPGTGEWMVILFIGLLIFGRRLPEVARSLGKSVNEFKKGLREFQDSADEVVSDVNRIKNDVASDIKEAAELDTIDKDVQDFQHSAVEGESHDITGEAAGDDTASEVQSASDPGNIGTGEGQSHDITGESAGDASPETREDATANNPYPDVGPMH